MHLLVARWIGLSLHVLFSDVVDEVVSAQLIEAATGRHVWAERYDRDLEEIFAVQDEVTERIVWALTGKVEVAEIARSKMRRVENLDAEVQHGMITRILDHGDPAQPMRKETQRLATALADADSQQREWGRAIDRAAAPGHAALVRDLFVSGLSREEFAGFAAGLSALLGRLSVHAG